MTRARIIIADDHILFRDGIASLINTQDDFEVIAKAEDGLEAFRLAKDLKPDAVIMDINMPISNGIEATVLIHSHLPDISIIVLTASDSDKNLFDAIKAGAVGYILKDTNADSFLTDLRSVIAGDGVLPPNLARKLLKEFSALASSGISTGDTLPYLTLREREVLELIVQGMSNKEIAAELFISLSTTKCHVKNILNKLHAVSRKQAAQISLDLKAGVLHKKLNPMLEN